MNKHFMAGSNFLWSSVRLQVVICFITLTQVIRAFGRMEKEKCLALQHSLTLMLKAFQVMHTKWEATQMMSSL